ncbi:MAG: hypothetical protein IIW81_05035, partial [Oscillospiraceae bacterium]|nr:hypothetical protein [Oscillospiraceae bacterium]
MSTESLENENLIEKKRRIEKMKKKKGRKKLILILLILLIVFLVNRPLKGDKGKLNAKFDYEKVAADVGDIEVIVEGKV